MIPIPFTLKEWSEKTIRTFNGAFKRVTDALANGLTVRDNVAGAALNVRWNSDQAPQFVPYGKAPRFVAVLAAKSATEPESEVVSFSPIRWRVADGGIVINDIPDLTPGEDYTVDLLMVED